MIADVGQNARRGDQRRARGQLRLAVLRGHARRARAPTRAARPAPPSPVLEKTHGAPDDFCSITGGYVVRDPGLPTLLGPLRLRRLLQRRRCARWTSTNPTSDAAIGINVSSLSSFGEDACGRLLVVSLQRPGLADDATARRRRACRRSRRRRPRRPHTADRRPPTPTATPTATADRDANGDRDADRHRDANGHRRRRPPPRPRPPPRRRPRTPRHRDADRDRDDHADAGPASAAPTPAPTPTPTRRAAVRGLDARHRPALARQAPLPVGRAAHGQDVPGHGLRARTSRARPRRSHPGERARRARSAARAARRSASRSPCAGPATSVATTGPRALIRFDARDHPVAEGVDEAPVVLARQRAVLGAERARGRGRTRRRGRRSRR